MTQPDRSMSSAGRPCGVLSREVVTEEQFADDLVRFDACEPAHEHEKCCQQQPHSPIPDSASKPPLPDSSDSPISFLKIIQACLQNHLRSHVGLRDFILHSCERDPRIADLRPQLSKDLFPCPPPLWRWTGSQQLSPRRRQRMKFLKLRNSVVQQIIGILNWEALGHVSTPPPQAKVGFGFTDAQLAMIERIESLVTHFLVAGTFHASSLGRSADKLSRLFVACRELPDEGLEVDLLDVVSNIRSSLDPYGKSFPGKADESQFRHHPDGKAESSFSHQKMETQLFDADSQVSQTSNPKSETPVMQNKVFLDSCAAKPVIADRIKWEHSPQFDPRPYLIDPVVKAAFENPDALRLPEDQWIKRPQGKVHCSKKEVLKLAEKWDKKGACRIFRCSEISPDEAVGIFAVSKDQTWDRLILNPVVINGKMKPYSNYTKSLAPGCLFSLVQLGENELLRLSADDLAEMYYTFKVPDLRARRNSIRMGFKHHELRHLSCFDSQLHFGDCFVALGALAMGDSLAVEIAQQAHFQVLTQLAGALRESERVSYRKAFPRGSFFEFLAIDDHVGAQIVSKTAYLAFSPLRDTEVFRRSENAYKLVNLVQHPKKRRRDVISGTFLGAEIDGLTGRVSAPRHRIGLLMLCTSIIVMKGHTTRRILSSILGCWISVLMFRRPILSVMSAVFAEGQQEPQDKVFKLSQQARNELLALSILGPVAQTDLRTKTCSKVFCMDASPSGAAICQVDEDESVVAELWRHSEQKGFYTRLESTAAATLHELGIEPEPAFESDPSFLPTDVKFPPPRCLREGFLYDAIELFKGTGNWSTAHSEVGMQVHAGLDVHGRMVQFGDLMDRKVFDALLSFALRGIIRDWHAGPPCFTFGTLRRPRIRSKLRPAGFNMHDSLTSEQNSLAWRTAFLLNIAMSQGSFVSCEQPGSSVMFYLHAFISLALRGCVQSKFCFCSYGAGFMKPSKWLHNKPWLLELESHCQCKSASEHFVIQGTFTRDRIAEFESKCKPSSLAVFGVEPKLGQSVASYSAMYPLPLVRRMALGSLAHKDGYSSIIPLSRKIDTLNSLGVATGLAGGKSNEQSAMRPWYQDPDWLDELADCLPFKELLRYKFKKTGHINVLECRTYKTFLKHAAKHFPNSRVLALLDSRVTLGAAAKGRSSSYALSRVLQGALGYVIGGGLYPGGLHVCSERNRSDGPSRNRPVPPPTKEVPQWLVALRQGNYEPFDAVLSASHYEKVPGRWVRLLLLIAGDIERNPGPNPRERRPRGPFDLKLGFAQATALRMDQCLKGFKLWVTEHLECDFSELCLNAHGMALALRGYGCFLYEQGHPRYLLVYAITAVADLLPHFRSFLSPAWQIDRKWQLAEPGECRPVISAPIMRAALVLSLLWGWHRWAAVSMIGYLGMLHPAEFLALRRQDLVLPRDSMLDKPLLYIHLRNPKTARFARRQHAKIEDCLVIRFLDALLGDEPMNHPLFPASASAYRKQWDHIMERLDVPHSRASRGATPAVLRGSGATHLYLATEDVQLIAWRGRWTKLKTVEFYLQEVAAQLILQSLPSLARNRIAFLSDHARSFLCRVISDLEIKN